MKDAFGQYVRKLRTSKGLTLTQLAAQVDLDSANLSKIENGKRDFDEKRLEKLSRALGVDIMKLKSEYYSDFIARKIYESACPENTLILAEQKIRYLKQTNTKQTDIKF
jgi:HTH-type transcriptional regulator, competence development regulator